MKVLTPLELEVKKELSQIRHKGIPPGVDLGFEALRGNWNWKKGRFCYIYGSPSAGKSYLDMSLNVITSHLHGWKHTLYSPEMGSTAEFVTEIARVVLGKWDVTSNEEFGVSEERWERCMHWIDRHFRFVTDIDTMEDIEQADDELLAQGWKTDTLTIDPFNQLRHNLEGGGYADYLQKFLKKFGIKAREKDQFRKIIVHPVKLEERKVKVQMSNGAEKMHFPVVQKDQIMWGQEWARQGDQMVSIWRPLQYKENGVMVRQLSKDGGGELPEGIVVVAVQKIKQKETGTVSENAIYYDIRTCRYYEKIGVRDVSPLDNLVI